jgi:hypothetical protein
LNARITTTFPVSPHGRSHWIDSPPINGCKAFNSSRAFMSNGIPSENLSIPSFMVLPMSDCAAAATVAVMTGMNC